MKTIDESPNATALAFVKMITSVAEKLSGDELLYFSRSEEVVLEKLKMKEVEFVQELTDEAGIVSACIEETLRDVWAKGQFRNMHQGEIPVSIENDLKQKYPATPERVIMPYRTICYLSMQELKSFIGQDLSNSVLTPQQVSKLMSEQSFRKRSGPLSFDESNYILMKGKRDEVIPMLLFWKKNKDSPFAKNAWNFWERKNVTRGRLILAV